MASSPADLRRDELYETMETYHPRLLVLQANLESRESEPVKKGAEKPPAGWLSRRLGQSSKPRPQGSLRARLSKKIARLSSLESNRSSSSTELENNDQQHQPPPPLISITTSSGVGDQSLAYKRRQRNFRMNSFDYDEEDELEQLEELENYNLAGLVAGRLVGGEQQVTLGDQEPETDAGYEEDPLDDRQGMNSGEQQFTKGEKMAARVSIDGSISSEAGTSETARKKSPARGSSWTGKWSHKDKQRRSKSPSASSVSNMRQARSNRHSRRGLAGLASRLRLTKRHESIVRLQLSILNSGLVSLKFMDRDLQTFLPLERMSPKEFGARVKLMRKYEVLATIEYRFASRYETYVCRHAQQESNHAKNNYKKCIPYDYNRVVLRTLANIPDSDYINASHVDSYLKPNAYIAAQGPNENTIEDFWRMIWEQKSFVVVMLTKVFDFIRVMCNQYWPVELNKPERYGMLEVTLLYEEPLADFVIRTIKLTKLRASATKPAAPDQANDLDSPDANQAANAGAKSDSSSHSSDSSGEIEYGSSAESLDSDMRPNQDSTRPESSCSALPSVRAPKYRARRRRQQAHLSPPASPLPKDSASASPEPPASNPVRVPRALDWLHPLSAAARQAAPSMSSLSGSLPGTPTTPITPRTPSSAGLDRSSATRRAVKKKRRAGKRNARPHRTQFRAPDASQLADDDCDQSGNEPDEYNEPNGNGNEAQADPESANLAGHPDEAGPGLLRPNERIIYQFHYNGWASHTCPFINSLLHFRRRVRICMDEMSKSGKTGPTVVHCNDGCGRTGTYLCIDANLELAEEDNVYDVYNYTKKMRQSRKFLIESLEQYRFVYDTIEEAMFCGRTWFPVSELHKRLKHKSQRNPATKKNEYQREYEKITRMTSKFSIGDCAGGHRVENREKNRDVSTVPPDNFRPYLNSFQSNDSTDYINAVFVDGYTRSKEYIVTEWPLHRTISDFWSLVYDHDCNSVILLANPGESSAYPSFLPSEKELRRKFGPVFSAEMVSYTHYQNIKSWIYTINKKIVSLTEVIAGVKSEAKTTQVFQITCWPQGHRVPTSTNALVELMNMVERWRQRTAYGPVCVVSLDGKSRAGVYCAANVAIEQVVQHSEVDVFQAVKTVRRHRPQLIENMTEYKYCYDLILHYVLHYVNQTPAV